MRGLFFAFVVGHAAVHAVMWSLPFTDAAAELPFNPAHCWLLGDHRLAAAVLAGLVAVAYVAAGAGWLGHAAWWPTTMVAASAMSLPLMALFFAGWWLVGIVLSAGLIAYALQANDQVASPDTPFIRVSS